MGDTKRYKEIESAALAYGDAGFRVIPLEPHDTGRGTLSGKKPLFVRWPDLASSSEGTIASWWRENPKANLGMPLGEENGLVCIDIDPRNGGMWFWEDHKSKLEKGVVEISGRGDGGLHVFFRFPASRAGQKLQGNLGAGVDFLAHRGKQVVVAPSIHALTDEQYICVSELDLSAGERIPECPEWVLELIDAAEEVSTSGEGLDLSGEITKADRDRIEEAIFDLDASKGRHQQIGGWIVDAVAARLPDDEIECMATEWLESQGRGAEEQPDEVYHWIQAAKRELSSGKMQPSRSGLRTDRYFQPLDAEAVHAEIEAAAPTESEKEAALCMSQEGVMSTLSTTKDGAVKTLRHNLLKILTYDERARGCLAWNEMAMALAWVSPPPWDRGMPVRGGIAVTDNDILEMLEWISTEYQVEFPTSRAWEAAIQVGLKKKYHPVREYLSGLEWDGRPRLVTWLRNLCNAEGEDEYLAEVGVRSLIAAVARVWEPGCQVDQMVVLEGAQGIGKSSILRILGGEWFTDDLGGKIGEKDTVAATRAYWIVEIAELAGFSKVEIENRKAWQTRRVDRCRDAYARAVQDYPRQWVPWATTNSDAYLADETGGRRYLPVRLTGAIDRDGLSDARDQLWAEAMAKYSAGEHWYIRDERVLAMAIQAQEDRYQGDAWEEVIASAIAGKDIVTLRDLWVTSFGEDDSTFGFGQQRRMGNVLRRMGWTRKKVWLDGAARNCFVREESVSKSWVREPDEAMKRADKLAEEKKVGVVSERLEDEDEGYEDLPF